MSMGGDRTGRGVTWPDIVRCGPGGSCAGPGDGANLMEEFPASPEYNKAANC